MFQSVLVPFAVFVAMTHLSMLIGISFFWYSLFGLLAVIGSGSGILLFRARASRLRPPDELERRERSATSGLLLLAAALASAIALGVVRPDADDAYYLPRALFYLDNPHFPLSTVVRGLANTGVTYHAFVTSCSQPLEFFVASWAYWLNLSFITVYHVLVPFAAAVGIVLAWFLCLRCFVASETASAVGALALIIALICLGETHHSYGNFSLARIWQGKVIFFSLALPIFCAYSIKFLSTGNLRSWLMLSALAMASSGLVLSSLFILPFLALSLFVGWILVTRPGPRKLLATGLTYVSTLTYLVIIGLVIILAGWSDVGRLDVMMNERWPRDFVGHFGLFFGEVNSFTFVTVLATFLSTCYVVPREQRSFLVGWALSVLVFFLNPWTDTLLIEWITTPNTYWRLFFLLPFPLTAGLLFSRLFLGLKYPPLRALGVALLISTFYVSITHNWVPHVLRDLPFHLGALKVNGQEYHSARAIIDIAQEGPMLSAYPMSTTIPMLTTKYPQISVRGDVVATWGVLSNDAEMGTMRRNAWMFVTGTGVGEADFLRLVDAIHLQSIVIPKTLSDQRNLVSLLARRGFSDVRQVDRYLVFQEQRQ